MYQYFNGLIIREGSEGLPGNKLKNLYCNAG